MIERNDENDADCSNDDENDFGCSYPRSEENVKASDLIQNETASTDSIDPAVKYANLFVFSGGNKAGMQAMDKAKQAQVIYEMSKNTPYFKRAMKLDEEATLKAKRLQKAFLEVKGPLEIRLQTAIEQRYCELEKRRSLSSHICCVLDMDMFFAAVEIRDQPHLADVPVAVGGIGMISTSNYVARQYGVRAAMPGFIAKKLCPHLVFVRSNFDKYQIVSNQIKAIISEYDPNFSSWSLDEVYFDLINASKKKYYEEHSGVERSSLSSVSSLSSSFVPLPNLLANEEIADEEEEDGEDPIVFNNHKRNLKQHPSASVQSVEPSIFELRKIAVSLLQEIRQRIKTDTNGLTCSAGMANNFFLAKIGADINKPDGQYELSPTRDAVLSFLTSLPTRKIGGIGKVMEKMLSELGIHTIGDIRENACKILHAFTPISASFLLRVSLGIASEEGEDQLTEADVKLKQVESRRKSIGCERTFSAKGIFNREDLYQKLKEISQNVSNDIKDHSSSFLGGKCVTLKVKDINFNLFTKAHTITSSFISSSSASSSSTSSSSVLCEADEIFKIAKELLDSYLPMKVRLLGLTISKLVFREETTGNKKSVMDYFGSKNSRSTVMDVGQNHVDDHGESRDSFDVFGVEENHPSSDRYDIVDLIDQDDDLNNSTHSHDGYSSFTNEVPVGEGDEMRDDDDDEQEVEEHLVLSQHDYDCPICGISILKTTLKSFNQHIDECLTKNSLKEVLSESDDHTYDHSLESGFLAKRSTTSTSSVKPMSSNKKQKKSHTSSIKSQSGSRSNAAVDISLFFSGK
jgi:DNA polymerase kappa